MERPLWDRIQEIYYLTLPVVEPERDEFVDRACGSDQFLVREVSSLLEADKISGDFLQTTVFELGLRIISSNSAEPPEDPDVDLSEDLVGSTVEGRYLVERKLGHGGIGTVYLARDLSLHNRPVVIKVLSVASLQDPYVVKKFRQEVEALARIDHPGVVNVLSAGRLADGKPYIGMQYIKGVTLRSQITNEGMDFERAASILRQVGDALDDVHEKGIFHRDLKPENIMLQTLKSGRELVKIVDFGIAKVKDSVVAPSTVNEVPVGTVLYMSPEQLRAEKVTALSDIYSMAVIAYEMATGRRPFNPTSGPQLLEMHRAGVRVKPIDLRSGLSTEAQAIILRGLSFDPKDRYQDASEFGNHLARALTSEVKIPAPAKQRDAAEFPAMEPTEVAHPNTVSNAVSSTSDSSPVAGVPRSGSTAEHSPTVERRNWSRSTWIRVGAGGFLILLCLAVFSVYIFRGGNQAFKPNALPERSFTYWLTVQKMRDGKAYQDPFQSSGQEIFENGYKFRLNVGGPDPGYLYVFNEGPPEEDGTTFTLIYPTRSKGGTLIANQSVQTNWNTFRGQAGTENFWIIWSVKPVDQLESAKTLALENPKGALTDPNSIKAVKEFLASHSSAELTSTKDPTTQTTNVRGSGDVLVKLAKLEHR